MARGKHPRSKEQSAAQSHRTANNQIKRYTKLLADRPQHEHKKVWTTRLEQSWDRLK